MDRFDRADSVFANRIDEILVNVSVREGQSFFRRNQSELFAKSEMRTELRAEMVKYLQNTENSKSVFYRGLYLQLYGSFERLICDIAAAVLSSFQLKAGVYSKLDEHLRGAHTVGAAKVLSKMHEQLLNGEQFDFIGLQTNLAKCFTDAESYQLIPDGSRHFWVFALQSVSISCLIVCD
jgi:hypothetical protein